MMIKGIMMKGKYANFAAVPPDNDQIRNQFQRDRDRIMYAKPFRRLAGKTQVFVTGYDDHVRTRLTHTLEVAQIGKTIGAYIGLNCDLIEAIAYGHDIGHAPFGHAGERTINYYANGCISFKGFSNRYPVKDKSIECNSDYLRTQFRGFKHNWQAIRILEDLLYHDGNKGLGISKKTLYGILYHTKIYYKCHKNGCQDLYHKYLLKDVVTQFCKVSYRDNSEICTNPGFSLGFYKRHYKDICSPENFSYEAVVVAIADEIAQCHHDVEDGIKFGLTDKSEVIKVLGALVPAIAKRKARDCADIDQATSIISKEIVNSYVNRTIKLVSSHLVSRRKEADRVANGKLSLSEVKQIWKDLEFSKIYKDNNKIAIFMQNKIMGSLKAHIMDGRARNVISKLFEAYISDPRLLPDHIIKAIFMDWKEYYDNRVYLIFANKKLPEPNYKYPDSLQEYIDHPDALRKSLYRAHKNGQFVYKAIVLRRLCDYISGMTDNKAIDEFHRLYGIDTDLNFKLSEGRS